MPPSVVVTSVVGFPPLLGHRCLTRCLFVFYYIGVLPYNDSVLFLLGGVRFCTYLQFL